MSKTTIASGGLADSAVASAKIADSAVASAKIADSAVASAKIADNAVVTGKITDGTIATADIAGDAITEAKIADNAVESEHLNNNIISGQTALTSAPDDTDEFLVSDAGTLKRIDYSLIKGGGTFVPLTSFSGASTGITIDSVFSSTYDVYQVIFTKFDGSSSSGAELNMLFRNGGSSLSSSLYTGRRLDAGTYNNSNRAQLYGDNNRVREEGGPGYMILTNTHESGSRPRAMGALYVRDDTGANNFVDNFGFQYKSNTAVDGMHFYGSNWNTLAGIVYGVKTS